MGRGNPIALVFFALFISIIEVGTSALQRTQGVPVELTLIVEALILIFVLIAEVVRRKR
jgi:simple sugar transport system permease protein